MSTFVKKNWLSLLIVLAIVSSAYAAATKFTNVTITGVLTTVTAAITGNQTVTGTSTLTGRTTLGAPMTPYIRTLAQLNALTPDTTGQMVFCSDCTRSAIAVSSGSHPTASVGAWVVPIATGTFVGSTWSGLPHIQ